MKKKFALLSVLLMWVFGGMYFYEQLRSPATDKGFLIVLGLVGVVATLLVASLWEKVQPSVLQTAEFNHEAERQRLEEQFGAFIKHSSRK